MHVSHTELVARLRAISSLRCSAGGFDPKRLAAPALTVIVGVLLLVVFEHLSRSVDYKSVMHALRGMTPAAWAAALFATALSFAALVGRDVVGLRHIGAKVPRSLLWVGATIGSARGNLTGFGAADVTPEQVGRLSIVTFAAGSMLVISGATPAFKIRIAFL